VPAARRGSADPITALKGEACRFCRLYQRASAVQSTRTVPAREPPAGRARGDPRRRALGPRAPVQPRV